eukprot:137291_1
MVAPVPRAASLTRCQKQLRALIHRCDERGIRFHWVYARGAEDRRDESALSAAALKLSGVLQPKSLASQFRRRVSNVNDKEKSNSSASNFIRHTVLPLDAVYLGTRLAPVSSIFSGVRQPTTVYSRTDGAAQAAASWAGELVFVEREMSESTKISDSKRFVTTHSSVTVCPLEMFSIVTGRKSLKSEQDKLAKKFGKVTVNVEFNDSVHSLCLSKLKPHSSRKRQLSISGVNQMRVRACVDARAVSIASTVGDSAWICRSESATFAILVEYLKERSFVLLVEFQDSSDRPCSGVITVEGGAFAVLTLLTSRVADLVDKVLNVGNGSENVVVGDESKLKQKTNPDTLAYVSDDILEKFKSALSAESSLTPSFTPYQLDQWYNEGLADVLCAFPDNHRKHKSVPKAVSSLLGEEIDTPQTQPTTSSCTPDTASSCGVNRRTSKLKSTSSLKVKTQRHAQKITYVTPVGAKNANALSDSGFHRPQYLTSRSARKLSEKIAQKSREFVIPESDPQSSSSQSRNTDSSESMNMSSSQSRNTASSESRNTDSSQSRNTGISQSRNTASSQSRDTVSSLSRDTVILESRNTVSSQSRNTTSSQSRNTTSSQYRNRTSSQSRNTTSSQSRNTISSQSRNTCSSQSWNATYQPVQCRPASCGGGASNGLSEEFVSEIEKLFRTSETQTTCDENISKLRVRLQSQFNILMDRKCSQLDSQSSKENDPSHSADHFLAHMKPAYDETIKNGGKCAFQFISAYLPQLIAQLGTVMTETSALELVRKRMKSDLFLKMADLTKKYRKDGDLKTKIREFELQLYLRLEFAALRRRIVKAQAAPAFLSPAKRTRVDPIPPKSLRNVTALLGKLMFARKMHGKVHALLESVVLGNYSKSLPRTLAAIYDHFEADRPQLLALSLTPEKTKPPAFLSPTPTKTPRGRKLLSSEPQLSVEKDRLRSCEPKLLTDEHRLRPNGPQLSAEKDKSRSNDHNLLTAEHNLRPDEHTSESKPNSLLSSALKPRPNKHELQSAGHKRRRSGHKPTPSSAIALKVQKSDSGDIKATGKAKLHKPARRRSLLLSKRARPSPPSQPDSLRAPKRLKASEMVSGKFRTPFLRNCANFASFKMVSTRKRSRRHRASAPPPVTGALAVLRDSVGGAGRTPGNSGRRSTGTPGSAEPVLRGNESSLQSVSDGKQTSESAGKGSTANFVMASPPAKLSISRLNVLRNEHIVQESPAKHPPSVSSVISETPQKSSTVSRTHPAAFPYKVVESQPSSASVPLRSALKQKSSENRKETRHVRMAETENSTSTTKRSLDSAFFQSPVRKSPRLAAKHRSALAHTTVTSGDRLTVKSTPSPRKSRAKHVSPSSPTTTPLKHRHRHSPSPKRTTTSPSLLLHRRYVRLRVKADLRTEFGLKY